jgi:hypothetical protein
VPAFFQRDSAVTIDGSRFIGGDLGIRFAFNLTRDLDQEPNKGQVKIWNPSALTRLRVESRLADPTADLIVAVEAGYVDASAQVFRGDVTTVDIKREGPDWVLTIGLGDGASAWSKVRINESFAPGVSPTEVMDRAVDVFGDLIGNAKEKIKAGDLSGAVSTITSGTTLSGPAAKELGALLNSYGYEWSFQNGVMQVIEKGKPAQQGTSAILLTTRTGMVGTPEKLENGRVRATSLLNPEYEPGRLVEIRSVTNDTQGVYRAESVNIVGDTHGAEWYSVVEGGPIKGATT